MKYLLLCCLLFVSSINAQTFTFTAIPDEDESRLSSRFDKVALYLTEQLGVDVKYVPVKSYSAAISAFRNNPLKHILSPIIQRG